MVDVRQNLKYRAREHFSPEISSAGPSSSPSGCACACVGIFRSDVKHQLHVFSVYYDSSKRHIVWLNTVCEEPVAFGFLARPSGANAKIWTDNNWNQ